MRKIYPGDRGAFTESLCWSNGKVEVYVVCTQFGSSFACTVEQWDEIRSQVEKDGTALISELDIKIFRSQEIIKEDIFCVDPESGNDVPTSDAIRGIYLDDAFLESGFSLDSTRLWLEGDTWTDETA